MKFPAALVLLIVLWGISAAGAAGVALTTPQSEYYIRVGEEGTIPLAIVSTYDHDITGTLTQTMMPVTSGYTGSRGPGTVSRTFSAFTEERTVSLPVGTSDKPADFDLAISFGYPEDGGRISAINKIRVHFVAGIENPPANHETLSGSDTPDPAAGKSPDRPAAGETPQARSQEEQLQASQMPQDMSALKSQMAKESNRSENNEDELQGYILADPLITSLDREVKGAGFALAKTDISPVSNRSGLFLLTYSSGAKEVNVRGAIRETRVQFAEETSSVPVPLPDVLISNTTYQEYGSRIAELGFLRRQTRINVTPDHKTIDLTYSDTNNRNLHLKAGILGGKVIAIQGDDPTDPLAAILPVIGLAAVLLISTGIWYLARHRPVEKTVLQEGRPETRSHKSPREIASSLLDEAEQDAGCGSWPDAYRKTGRALRFFLSHERGSGRELTGAELEQLIGLPAGDSEQVRFILDRCRKVGFAQELPPAGELPYMIRIVRAMLSGRDGEEGPNNKAGLPSEQQGK